jgi:hypothetical protein
LPSKIAICCRNARSWEFFAMLQPPTRISKAQKLNEKIHKEIAKLINEIIVGGNLSRRS